MKGAKLKSVLRKKLNWHFRSPADSAEIKSSPLLHSNSRACVAMLRPLLPTTQQNPVLSRRIDRVGRGREEEKERGRHQGGGRGARSDQRGRERGRRRERDQINHYGNAKSDQNAKFKSQIVFSLSFEHFLAQSGRSDFALSRLQRSLLQRD